MVGPTTTSAKITPGTCRTKAQGSRPVGMAWSSCSPKLAPVWTLAAVRGGRVDRHRLRHPGDRQRERENRIPAEDDGHVPARRLEAASLERDRVVPGREIQEVELSPPVGLGRLDGARTGQRHGHSGHEVPVRVQGRSVDVARRATASGLPRRPPEARSPTEPPRNPAGSQLFAPEKVMRVYFTRLHGPERVTAQMGLHWRPDCR